MPQGRRYRIAGEVGIEVMLAIEGSARCTTDGVPSGIQLMLTPEELRIAA
ncbi:hypothetical protein WME97_33585 [Sorangium sp. So ce367]